MNFKTTILLIVLLAGAGAWLYFSHEPAKPDTDASATTSEGTKLVDIDAKDVTKIIVTPADGPEFAIEKQGDNWQLTKPVSAAAETFEVDSLIRAVTDARSRGEMDPSGANAAATGLAKPRYHVQLVTAVKTVNLAVGEKSAVGDTLYVQLDGNSQAQLIPTDLSDRLDKSADPYRKKNLVSATSDQIRQITIDRRDGKIVLQKSGENWQMIEPVKMPVDETAASDLVFAITGLRTETFADAASLAPTVFANPPVTVSFSAAAPITLPATAPATQSAWTTIQFGSSTDILRKNVYVTVAGSGVIGQVPMSDLDAFKKKPLDLRNKKAVDIDPDQVSRITIQTDVPSTTQPTTRPAVNMTVTLDRRKVNPVLGPAFSLPTTEPTAGPSTNPAALPAVAATGPSTAPAAPLSKWVVVSDSGSAADDAKVTSLLTAVHPLHADKYLESAPVTLPAGTYTLTIVTTAPGGSAVENKITLLDPGHDAPLLATYNGLTFETARTILTDLQGNWKK